MSRIVAHFDLDYFYAQVEEVQDPSIRERPVIVCVFSGRTADSGVVSTSNYVARALDVRSGMPIVVAKKRLEGKNPAIFKMDRPKYERVSERVMDVLRGQTDVVEQTGIDEAFLDLTKSSGGSFPAAVTICQGIKSSVLEKERLTCTIGIGTSKAVAKIASDFAKPDGLKSVPPESTSNFLFPLPVAKLSGVGPKTEGILKALGISTLEQLAKAPVQDLEAVLGRKLAAYLASAAKGEEDDPVVLNQGRTQMSKILTLKQDTRDPAEISGQLGQAVQELHEKILESGKSFRVLTFIGIMTDLDLRTKSRSFESPIMDIETMRDGLSKLVAELVESTPKSFRRAGVRLSDLREAADQKSLSEFANNGR